jgi:magnesium transporter
MGFPGLDDLVPKRRGRRARSSLGAPAGSITPAPDAPPPVLDVFAYDGERSQERRGATLDDVRELRARHRVTWVNVTGLGDAALIEKLGEIFGLHRLALEDAVHTHQRPKVDEFADHLFVVFRAPEPRASDAGEEPEQISMFLGRDYLVTFQERVGDCLDPLRERLRRERSKLRSLGPDALAHAVLDTAIDAYFPEVEGLGDRIERIEERVMRRPTPAMAAQIYGVKHALMHIRRAVWPLRDVVNALVRDQSSLISPDTRVYLRDCYDHTVQLMDLVEMHREVASGLMELYLSNVSNRMNQIMKVLTVMSTLFMPLTFIVGVYGMNFDTSSPWNMPELKWRYGYVMVVGLMAAVVMGMIWYFARKGWLRER